MARFVQWAPAGQVFTAQLASHLDDAEAERRVARGQCVSELRDGFGTQCRFSVSGDVSEAARKWVAPFARPTHAHDWQIVRRLQARSFRTAALNSDGGHRWQSADSRPTAMELWNWAHGLHTSTYEVRHQECRRAGRRCPTRHVRKPGKSSSCLGRSPRLGRCSTRPWLHGAQHDGPSLVRIPHAGGSRSRSGRLGNAAHRAHR